MGNGKSKEELEKELNRACERLTAYEKLESLGILAGSIANDFNNLLTAILGNVSLTRMSIDPDSKAFLRLAEAEKACQRARNLTKQLLTLSEGGEFPAPEKPLTSRGEEGNAALAGRGKILIMDDEEMVRRVAGETLSNLGYEVEFARGGNEAIERYITAKQDNKPFDLVILDLKVPDGMGGGETISYLTGIDPNVKVIVSSGYANDPIMSNFRAYGFKGAITKPYRLEELSTTVSRLISAGDE